jgi:hypothetical protein
LRGSEEDGEEGGREAVRKRMERKGEKGSEEDLVYQQCWCLMELISTYKNVPTINSRMFVTVCINIDPSLK